MWFIFLSNIIEGSRALLFLHLLGYCVAQLSGVRISWKVWSFREQEFSILTMYAVLVGLQKKTLLREKKKYRLIQWNLLCFYKKNLSNCLASWLARGDFKSQELKNRCCTPDDFAGANLLPALDPRQQSKKFIPTFCRVPVVFPRPPRVQFHCTLTWPTAWNVDKIIPSSNEGCTHRAKLGTQTATAALQSSTVTNNEATAPVCRASGQPGFHDSTHAKAILHILH